MVGKASLLKAIAALERLHASDPVRLRNLASLRAEVELLGMFDFKAAGRIKDQLRLLARVDEASAVAHAPAARLHGSPTPGRTAAPRPLGEARAAVERARAAQLFPKDLPLDQRIRRIDDNNINIDLTRGPISRFELELTVDPGSDLKPEVLDWALHGDELGHSGERISIFGRGEEGRIREISWVPDPDGNGGELTIGSDVHKLNGTNNRICVIEIGDQRVWLVAPGRDIDVPVITTHGIAPKMPN